MKYRISIDKHQFDVRVDNLRSRPIVVTVDGETFEVWPEGQEAAPAAATQEPAPPLPDTALRPGAPLPTAAAEVAETAPALGGVHRVVRAPLPGVIISLAVGPGAAVSLGQELCVLEAMKMKNPIRATRAGTVKAVHVAVGQTVKHHDLLLEYSD
jgi:biotin carboxyl carrier protein